MAKCKVKWQKQKSIQDVLIEMEDTADLVPPVPYVSPWMEQTKGELLKAYKAYLKGVREFVESLPEVEDIKALPIFLEEEVEE